MSALREAVPAADDLIRKADYSTKVNGWSVIYKITSFIKDSLLRASVNRLGPGAPRCSRGTVLPCWSRGGWETTQRCRQVSVAFPSRSTAARRRILVFDSLWPGLLPGKELH